MKSEPTVCPCYGTRIVDGAERPACYMPMMFTESEGGSCSVNGCEQDEGHNYIRCPHYSHWYWRRLILAIAPSVADRMWKQAQRKKRNGLSPKRRFAILKRDGFKCHYCGLTAEDGATLEVDHIVPVAAGGEDKNSNLVASCRTCNSGKSDQWSPPATHQPKEDA